MFIRFIILIIDIFVMINNNYFVEHNEIWQSNSLITTWIAILLIWLPSVFTIICIQPYQQYHIYTRRAQRRGREGRPRRGLELIMCSEGLKKFKTDTPTDIATTRPTVMYKVHILIIFYFLRTFIGILFRVVLNISQNIIHNGPSVSSPQPLPHIP